MRGNEVRPGQKPIDAFQKASSGKAPSKKKYPPPFSLRLTLEERAALDARAGTRPLGAYIRQQLLGGAVSPRKSRRRPGVDQEALGRALGTLGQSRLASNLNQIAKAANTGALPVTLELSEELRAACEHVSQMRQALIAALGIKPKD